MLLPVSGIVQAGAQSMADRYTYLPAIGLVIALVWTVADLLPRHPRWKPAAQVGVGVACAVLAVMTVRQQGVWQNTFTLMSHANEVTSDNWLARGHIANQLVRQNDLAGAERYYTEAVNVRPSYVEGWYNLGNLFIRSGRPAEAGERYQRALSIDPNHADARLGLGTAEAMQGNFSAAESSYREALLRKPNWPDALVNLGTAVRNQGRPEEAYRYYQEALRLQPDNARALRAMAELQGPTPAGPTR
jgi:tetratricopeptide (TPR) repeat protein